jgi:hypothetical protein
MIKDVEKYFEEMEKPSLPELEIRIKDRFKIFQKNHLCRDKELSLLLKQRKHLINRRIKLTPLIVGNIERMNHILTESTAIVLKKTVQLYDQMTRLMAEGDDFLQYFNVEGKVRLFYPGEVALLILDEDENSGQSDYEAMADILDYMKEDWDFLREFSFCGPDDPANPRNSDESFTDSTLELNWNIEVLSAPELSSIPYFCYASHRLFCDSEYSISDAIRINDFCNEVEVTYQNYGKQTG